MENTRFYTLLARKIAGEVTEHESAELIQLLHEEADRQWFYEFFCQWKEPAVPAQEEAYLRLMKRIRSVE